MIGAEHKASPVYHDIDQSHGCPRHANTKKEGKRSAEVEPEQSRRADKFHARAETDDSHKQANWSCESFKQLRVEICGSAP